MVMMHATVSTLELSLPSCQLISNIEENRLYELTIYVRNLAMSAIAKEEIGFLLLLTYVVSSDQRTLYSSEASSY